MTLPHELQVLPQHMIAQQDPTRDLSNGGPHSQLPAAPSQCAGSITHSSQSCYGEVNHSHGTHRTTVDLEGPETFPIPQIANSPRDSKDPSTFLINQDLSAFAYTGSFDADFCQ